MKSPNFKNHDFARFEEMFLFLPTLWGHFYRIFQKHLHINLYIYIYIYIQLVCYLDFQKLRKDLEILFPRSQKINFRKKQILAIFRIIFQKKWRN